MENNNTNPTPNNRQNPNWNYDPITGQPLNQQQTSGYNFDPATGQPTPQYINEQEKIRDNSDPNARNLCIASLIGLVVGNFLFFGSDLLYKLLGHFHTLFHGPATGFFFIGGFVLSIVSLVHYPKNKFAKVIFILYMVEFVLFIVAIIIAVVACAFFFQTCIEELHACGRMG